MTRSLRAAMAAAATVAFAAACLGISVPSTHGGDAAVDEPQFLMSALSLWEDGDLDIADELRAERWRAFHRAQLPMQTDIRTDGSQISPHDPLLPVLIAAPMAVGGWVAAKVALAAVAAGCAALVVWLAVRRFAVRPLVAATVSAVAFASTPLAVYGQQIYPELPAATLLLGAVAVATGRLSPRQIAVGVVCLVALPWLSVKYVPVTAAVALLLLARLLRARRAAAAAALAGVSAVAGAGYLWAHQVVYGGWTAYAAGDHFALTGEFSVVGVDPDYVGRSLRLAGLLVDRDYGLVPWQPAWLLAPVALAALVGRRPRGTAVVVGPVLVGWAVATWLALTMHGFWWPGRQVVVVLPLLAVGVAWWLQHVAGPAARWVAGAAGAAGVGTYVALLVGGNRGDLTWVSGSAGVSGAPYSLLRELFPDYRAGGAELWVRHGIWLAILGVLLLLSWRAARRRGPATQRT